MLFKDKKKQRKSSRECMKRLRERRAMEKETVNVTVNSVTDEEIDKLPQGEKDEIARVTGIMAACGVDNLRWRQETAVRRLRGH